MRLRRRGRGDGDVDDDAAAPAHAAPPAVGDGTGDIAGGKTAGDRGAPGPVVAVDPRMRSRRIAVRRDAGRRRLRRIKLVMGGVAALVLAAAATQSPLLDVDAVTVTGTARTSVEEVRAAGGVVPGEPLVGVDTGAVADRVEALPWVASADVRRSWPSTVEIQVSEREAVAMAPLAGDRVALVDRDGWVVTVEPAPAGAEPEPDPAGPVVLTDVAGSVGPGERLDAEARDALEVALAAAERMPGVLASVSTELDAPLVQGGTVRFGSVEDLTDKITAVETVLGQVDTACLEVLDVTVAGSPALTRNQRCS